MVKTKSFSKKQNDEISYRINNELRGDYDVRIVGEGITSEVVPLSTAKIMAENMEMDLIEINAKASPPIMRIGNYEKLIYEMKKAKKKNRQQMHQLKEIQLSVSISSHDIETKANKARQFIADGDKVKVVLSMKGRELLRREENKKSMLQFIVALEDVAVPEAQPRDEGNRTIVILKKRN